MSHALLSPSSAQRWLNCTPSARLEAQFPDTRSEAAAEGTLAHSIAELEIAMAIGLMSGALYKKRKSEFKTVKLYDQAMEEHVGNYASYIVEQFNTAKAHTRDAVIHLEQKLDLRRYIPEGFGTGDVVIIANGTLRIIDLKYGKGVPVAATDNKQMLLYALGALDLYDFLYDIQEVHMTICQPRLDSISDWIIPVNVLRAWAEEELQPKAKLAFAGEGEYAAGAHCRFCKARAVCRVNADFNLELAKHDFKPGLLLTDDEIADILCRVDLLTKWAASVQEHALDAALSGKRWPGWKLVEGRSNRVYSDATKVESVLLEKKFEPELIYAPKQLLGITALEKNIGKADFSEIVAPLLIKPAGKPALVPASDKRLEFSTTESAQADFAA